MKKNIVLMLIIAFCFGCEPGPDEIINIAITGTHPLSKSENKKFDILKQLFADINPLLFRVKHINAVNAGMDAICSNKADFAFVYPIEILKYSKCKIKTHLKLTTEGEEVFMLAKKQLRIDRHTNFITAKRYILDDFKYKNLNPKLRRKNNLRLKLTSLKNLSNVIKKGKADIIVAKKKEINSLPRKDIYKLIILSKFEITDSRILVSRVDADKRMTRIIVSKIKKVTLNKGLIFPGSYSFISAKKFSDKELRYHRYKYKKNITVFDKLIPENEIMKLY